MLGAVVEDPGLTPAVDRVYVRVAENGLWDARRMVNPYERVDPVTGCALRIDESIKIIICFHLSQRLLERAELEDV